MIKLLDKATIDKIAAGEVIERPLSVVKELLENSIDAKSTMITVEIKEGGLSFIRVTDNGIGIPKDQVKTAYLRHATSKIKTAEDLQGVTSLGFRGEALSTIAAVSQTEMVTKTEDSITGVKYTIHGGLEVELTEVGVPNGTTIIVRNLFYNTPARKKFLKTPMTEGSYIQDLVLKLALSHPEISFRLITNGQTKIETSGNGNPKDAIYQLFGRDITSNLIKVEDSWGEINITGYIGKPYISRGNRGLENYFINNRYIKSNIINRAIEEGYKTFVMQHKFPFTVLYIELPPDRIDVNVHPTKMEFKYDNEKELFEAVTRVVRDALNHKEIIPKEITKDNKDTEKTKTEEKKVKPAEPYEVSRRMAMKPQANFGADKYSPSYKILEELKKAENESKEEKSDNIALNLLKEEGVEYTPSKSEQGISSVNNEKSVNTDDIKKEDAQKTNTLKDNKQEVSHTVTKAIAAYNTEKTSQATLFDDDFLTEKARTKHRLIGQVFG